MRGGRVQMDPSRGGGRGNGGGGRPRGMVLADRKQPTGPIEVLTGEVLSPLVSPLFSARNPLCRAHQRLVSVNPWLRSFFSNTAIPAAVLPLLQSSMAPSVDRSGERRPSPPALPVFEEGGVSEGRAIRGSGPARERGARAHTRARRERVYAPHVFSPLLRTGAGWGAHGGGGWPSWERHLGRQNGSSAAHSAKANPASQAISRVASSDTPRPASSFQVHTLEGCSNQHQQCDDSDHEQPEQQVVSHHSSCAPR